MFVSVCVKVSGGKKEPSNSRRMTCCCCWRVGGPGCQSGRIQYLKGKRERMRMTQVRKKKRSKNFRDKQFEVREVYYVYRWSSYRGFVSVVSSALIKKQGQHLRTPPFPRDRKQLIRGLSSSLTHPHPLWSATANHSLV